MHLDRKFFAFVLGVAGIATAVLAQQTPPSNPAARAARRAQAQTTASRRLAAPGSAARRAEMTSAALAARRTTGTAGAKTPKPELSPKTEQQLEQHVFTTSKPTDLSSYFSLVYNGYRRSQLEPCGCVSHQLGGIDKEAKLIETIAKELPVVKADAGGFVRDNPNQLAQTQATYLVDALAALKYDVINVSAADLGAGVKFIRDLQSSSSLPLISANIVDETSKPLWAATKVVPVTLASGAKLNIGFIGVTRPRTNQSAGDYSFIDPAQALKEGVPELAKATDLVIALVYETREGAKTMLEKMSENPGIDIVVAGEFLTLSGNATEVNGIKLISGGFEGRQVGHMMIEFKDGKISNYRNQMMEVTQDITPVPEISKILTDYTKAAASVPRQTGPTGAVPAGKISFAGAPACKSCHQKESEQWQTTRHAKAIQTLVKKNQQFNNKCLPCHVTGFQTDNGFTDFRNSPQMANVQCEVCHGPGFQHVIQKRREQIAKQMGKPAQTPAPGTIVAMKTKFDEAFCVTCHDTANDKHWDFKRDLKLVDHSKTGDRPEDAPVTRETTGTAARDAN